MLETSYKKLNGSGQMDLIGIIKTGIHTDYPTWIKKYSVSHIYSIYFVSVGRSIIWICTILLLSIVCLVNVYIHTNIVDGLGGLVSQLSGECHLWILLFKTNQFCWPGLGTGPALGWHRSHITRSSISKSIERVYLWSHYPDTTHWHNGVSTNNVVCVECWLLHHTSLS